MAAMIQPIGLAGRFASNRAPTTAKAPKLTVRSALSMLSRRRGHLRPRSAVRVHPRSLRSQQARVEFEVFPTSIAHACVALASAGRIPLYLELPHDPRHGLPVPLRRSSAVAV